MTSTGIQNRYAALMACLGAGYGVLFTMLDDYRDEYGISESALGAVIGIGFFAGFLSQLVIAPLADRGHARQLVFGGMALNVTGLVLMAFSTSFLPLLAGRFVMGVGVGMAVPAIRRIVILAEPERLGNNLGRLIAADVGGFAAGPAVSALLVDPFGIPTPFLVIAGATLLVVPWVARTTVAEETAPVSQRFAVDLLRIRPFAGAVVLGSAVWLMIGAFDALWAVVLDDLDTAVWISNLGITLFALPLILLGAAGGRLSQRVGPFRVATVGLLLVAMFHAVSDGITVSSTGVAAGLVVPPERQAGGQGVLGACATLTAGLTALLTGIIYEHAGRTAAYATAAGLMVTFVAIGVTLARAAWCLRGAPAAPPAGLEEVMR
jgi:predicted MFS family arabinose efflux permease